MRKITSWTNEEIEEFNRLKKHGYSAIGIIDMIADNAENSPELNQKYAKLNIDKDNEFAQDILDLLTGKAEFPQNLYYVKFIDSNEGSYLNRSHQSSELHTDIKDVSDSIYQTEFTMKEINDIDPKYKEFAVPVN